MRCASAQQKAANGSRSSRCPPFAPWRSQKAGLKPSNTAVRSLALEPGSRTTEAAGHGISQHGVQSDAVPAADEPPNIGNYSLSFMGLTASPELASIALVYFAQGITELGTLAQTLYLKDDLGASPAQVAMYLSLAGLPWAIKPLIGFVSDTVPLFGYRRRSYLLLASLAGAAAYAWMGGEGAGAATSFVTGMMVASTAGAVSDVVVDSMVVERARREPTESAGSLQSLCWTSYACAQVLTASLSGSLVQAYGPRIVFQLTSVFPLLVGGTALALKEARAPPPPPAAPLCRPGLPVRKWLTALLHGTRAHRAGTLPYPNHSHSHTHRHPHNASSGVVGQQTALPSLPARHGPTDSLCSAQGNDATLPTTPALSPAAGVVPQLSAHAGPLAATHAPVLPTTQPAVCVGDAGSCDPAPAVALPGDASLSGRMQALWAALSRPDVAAPLAFLMLLSATPSADSALFFYQTEQLGFTPSFLGQIQLAAAVASLVGVVLYNTWLKRVPMRQLMLWGTLLAAGLHASQLVLVTGAHRALGLDDHLFVLGGNVITDVVQNVLSMPMMVLAARMCPPGMEATMFASLMSLLNLADGVRVAGGAGLMTALGVTADDFTHLPTLLAICNLALLLPLPLLGLIPDKFNAPEEAGEGAASAAAVAGAAVSCEVSGAGGAREELGRGPVSRTATGVVPGLPARRRSRKGRAPATHGAHPRGVPGVNNIVPAPGVVPPLVGGPSHVAGGGAASGGAVG